MAAYYDLTANQSVWNVMLTGFEENNPLIRGFRKGFLDVGIDPDSAGALKARMDFAKDQTEKAKRDKTAYNAFACLQIMTNRSLKIATELFQQISN